jgi:hypothetical protein
MSADGSSEMDEDYLKEATRRKAEHNLDSSVFLHLLSLNIFFLF